MSLSFSVTPLYGIISLQNFAHAMTAQLSCHVQNLIAIISPSYGWEQNEISFEFELRWKNRLWNGPHVIMAPDFISYPSLSCCLFIYLVMVFSSPFILFQLHLPTSHILWNGHPSLHVSDVLYVQKAEHSIYMDLNHQCLSRWVAFATTQSLSIAICDKIDG